LLCIYYFGKSSFTVCVSIPPLTPSRLKPPVNINDKANTFSACQKVIFLKLNNSGSVVFHSHITKKPRNKKLTTPRIRFSRSGLFISKLRLVFWSATLSLLLFVHTNQKYSGKDTDYQRNNIFMFFDVKNFHLKIKTHFLSLHNAELSGSF
jgi:hypothetical protein